MLTKYLNDCIKYIPKDKWFLAEELPQPVSRNIWTCNRLCEEGILEKKSEWRNEKDVPNDKRTDFATDTYYRLIPSHVSEVVAREDAPNRSEAIKWWKERTASEQFILMRKYNPTAAVGVLRLYMNSGHMVEDVWKKETQH